MDLQDMIRGRLLGLIGPGRVYENRKQLADAFEIDPIGLNNFLKGKKKFQSPNLERVLERLNARLLFPEDEVASAAPDGYYSLHEPGRPYGAEFGEPSTREVCWVEPRIIGVQNGTPPPIAEKYLAVPLAEGQVAAGQGMVPEDKVKNWVLVLRDHQSVKFRTNLVAVEIGRGQESMVPTLHPLDIVLVDKDDKKPEPDGQMFLVRDPDDLVMVKRVYVQRKNGEIMLNLTSDNPDKRSYPPMLYDLRSDYQDDITRAIVGKCVWAWSDLTRK